MKYTDSVTADVKPKVDAIYFTRMAVYETDREQHYKNTQEAMRYAALLESLTLDVQIESKIIAEAAKFDNQSNSDLFDLLESKAK